MTNEEFIADFREKNRRIRQRQDQEERHLASLVEQRLIEDSPGIPVLSFYAYGYEGIATVQIFGDCARLTRWTDIGPMGHFDIKNLTRLAHELRMEGFNPVDDPNAAQVLELWASRERWSQGLKTMQWG